MNITTFITKFINSEYEWYKGVIMERIKLRHEKRYAKHLEKVKKKADLLCETTGKKYWVLPDYDGTLLILSKENIETFKVHGKLSKRATMMDFERDALYVTQLSNKKYVEKKEKYHKNIIQVK